MIYGITSSLNEQSIVGTDCHRNKWMHHQWIRSKTTWREGDEGRWTSPWTNTWSSSPMAARPVTEDNGNELPCEESLTRCSRTRQHLVSYIGGMWKQNFFTHVQLQHASLISINNFELIRQDKQKWLLVTWPKTVLDALLLHVIDDPVLQSTHQKF